MRAEVICSPMRYSSKSSVLAVAVLLSGAAVFGSACGGSGSSDRNSAGGATTSAGATGLSGAGGATASAGTTSGGSSGTGTGGAATCDSGAMCCPTTTCVCPYPAGDGTAMKIADMEDNANTFKTATLMNVSGYWDFSRDATAGTSTPTANGKPLPVDGGANGTTKAMHISGMNLTGWGAALAAELSNGCPFDGSKYGGVSFWAKGTSTVLEGANKLLFLVGNPEYIPKANGGFCDDKAVPADQACYARHRVTIDLTPEWKKYIVAWEDLKAPTYLTTGKPFGANRIRDLVFNASGPSPDAMPAATFDFWIDEIEFVPTGTKGNVSMGGGGGAGAGGASGAGGAGGASAGVGGASAGAGGAVAGMGGSGG